MRDFTTSKEIGNLGMLRTNNKLKISALSTAALLCLSGALSANSDIPKKQNYPQIDRTSKDPVHASEVLDDMEDRLASKGESRGGQSSETKRPKGDVSLARPEEAILSNGLMARAPGCNYAWFLANHRWRYSRYVPSVYIKARMWIDSSSFYGGASNPEQCGRPPLSSNQISHSGGAFNHGHPTTSHALVRISASQNNTSSLSSYRRQDSYGSSVQSINCGISNHTFKYFGNRTFTLKRRSGGAC